MTEHQLSMTRSGTTVTFHGVPEDGHLLVASLLLVRHGPNDKTGIMALAAGEADIRDQFRAAVRLSPSLVRTIVPYYMLPLEDALGVSLEALIQAPTEGP